MTLGLHRSLPVERPSGPLRGYKLAYPMLSADRQAAGFGGIWSSAQAVYRVSDSAVCFWNRSHRPPKRRCSCGFYCLNNFEAARAMSCDSQYRSTVILDVEVRGRFLRYEEGLRYSNQRVAGVEMNRCLCGRPATVFVDSGAGITGWSRLEPCCRLCTAAKAVITLSEFGVLLGDRNLVRGDAGPGTTESVVPAPADADDAAVSSLSVLAAEVALLQARVDRLQEELSRLTG